MIARGWRKLGLMSRLAISCGVVLAVLSGVLVVNFVKTEVALRSTEYTSRLESKLSMLVAALTGPAILGDYTGVTELLAAFAHEPDVDRIEWTPARGKPVTADGAVVKRLAPAWFEALAGFPVYSGNRRIVVGGTDYGSVTLRLDPIPEINKIWAQVAVATLTALVGVGAMLAVMLLTVEHVLRSLARLVSGVRRFEGGDFSARVDPVGPPEIASGIVAFNLMAERVGAVFDSLRESETRNRRLAMIVEQSHESIVTRDIDGTITSWNRGAERMFGWSAAEVIGKSSYHVLGESADDTAYVRSLERLRSSETWTVEAPRLTKSGAQLEVSVTRAPLLDQDGKVVGEIRIARDIRELKKAQTLLINAKAELEARVVERTAQLALAKDESEAANRAKSAFLAAMSHEIRTPMNGVVGMIDVLEQGNLKSSQREIVQTIRASAYALLGIVDDVLDFSKIEAGQFQVDIEPMDVVGVVEGVCDTLQGLASQKGVELMLFTDPAIPARVLGDAMRLRQVLFNLVGNAIKFSSGLQRLGHVAVRARVVGQGLQKALEFQVSDDGIGMDAETLSRLFTPFTQADASTTRRYGGTGLGLSISHRLVELMGGELSVSSTLGEGSAFVLSLPALSVPSAPAMVAAAPGLTGLRCLVEGGPEGLAGDIAVYLEHAGATVQRVADPAAARQWLRDCAGGLCVVISAGSADALESMLAELRAVGATRPELELRFVAIELGLGPVMTDAADDLIVLRGALQHRSALVEAVAQAAGRSDRPAPATVGGDADTAPAPLESEGANAPGPLILVAEDNEINQQVLRQQLALLGFTAHIAGDGCAALELLRGGGYALLLTDLHMPLLDGYELAAAVREVEAGQRRMAIVAVTANAVKGEAQRCLASGMDDYMTKPVQLADLGAMLRKWLPGSAASVRLPPPAATTAPAPPALDLRVLEDLVGNEPGVIAGLLTNFRASASAAALQMGAACRAREPLAVQAVAHQLKASARSMGALALGELCAQMEAAGSARRLDTLDDLWPEFQTEMAAVDEFLSAAGER